MKDDGINEQSGESGASGNAKARVMAGVEQDSLSPAERQAQRRRSVAQLSLEVTPEQKAELLRAASDNGRSLRREVLVRLGLE